MPSGDEDEEAFWLRPVWETGEDEPPGRARAKTPLSHRLITRTRC